MFHFPGFAPPRLWIQRGVSWVCHEGFPHSGIPGSMPASGSPRLIAAGHALRRLSMPGHPPYALSSLTKLLPLITEALLVCVRETRCARYSVVKERARRTLRRVLQLQKQNQNLLAASARETAPALRFGPEARNGAERDRTADPLLAKQVLSQLSYSPAKGPEARLLDSLNALNYFKSN